MIPATVGLVRSVSRPISLKDFPHLYQDYTSFRLSTVVSRRAVTGSEGIFVDKVEKGVLEEKIYQGG